MKHSFPLCVLVLWAFCGLFADSTPRHKVLLHVLKADVDGELVATARHPAFGFHVESGAPAEDSWLVCEQSEEMRTKEGVQFLVIVATCGDVRMVLTGVDLGQ